VTAGDSSPPTRDTPQKVVVTFLLAIWISALAWKIATALHIDKSGSLAASLAAMPVVFGVYQAFGSSIHPAKFSPKVAKGVSCALVVLIAVTLTWPAVLKLAHSVDHSSAVKPRGPSTDPAMCEEKPYAASDWGPDRPRDPLDESNVPTFNNGVAEDGTDLRTWLVAARDAAYQDNPPPHGGYEQSIEVNEQSSYRIMIRYWNNANRRSGDAINDVRAFVRLPQCLSTDVKLVATVEGSNATPKSIWGTVHFHAERGFKLALAPDGGPGHRPVVCWPPIVRCNSNGGAGFVRYDPNELVGPEGLALPGGTLTGQAGVFILLYVRPVFD
jgi:hypothetical protein